MFKYLWILVFIVPYILWGVYSVKEIKKAYEIYKMKNDVFALPDEVITWFVVTILLLFMLGLTSFIVFILSIN